MYTCIRGLKFDEKMTFASIAQWFRADVVDSENVGLNLIGHEVFFCIVI